MVHAKIGTLVLQVSCLLLLVVRDSEEASEPSTSQSGGAAGLQGDKARVSSQNFIPQEGSDHPHPSLKSPLSDS